VAEVIEAQAEEELIGPDEPDMNDDVRPLPAKREAAAPVLREEARSVAVAAAGGLVAGAATIAAASVVRAGARSTVRRVLRRKPSDPRDAAIARRTVLIDIHVLEQRSR
jgi:hypothetical protein